ncbi:MAG: hypothetical protein GY842_19925 [bacterium]|nr:hypothetical protein [bacterium]
MMTDRSTVIRTMFRLAAVSALVCCVAGPAAASTVVPMGLPVLSDHSAQVFVGKVSAVRSYWAEGPRRIESEVTFDQVSYLKGALADAGSDFALTVPGGTVGEMQMQVCCTPSFRVGDKWVLFLLPEYRTFPVVGLYQGAFLVRPDDTGAERVYRRRHERLEPVVGFDAEGVTLVGGGRSGSVHEHLAGAHHARVAEVQPRLGDDALTLDEFLARVRPVLAESRAHALTEPAGRRVLVEYTPTQLRASRMQQARSQDSLLEQTRPRAASSAVEREAADRPAADAEKEVQP